MNRSFFDRLDELANQSSRRLLLALGPRLSLLPVDVTRFDEPLLPYGKAVVDGTRDLVSGYLFDLASYLALGASGAVALERTVAYVGPEFLRVLHGPFAHEGFMSLLDEASFNADAITVTPSFPAPRDVRRDKGYVICQIPHGQEGRSVNEEGRVVPIYSGSWLEFSDNTGNNISVPVINVSKLRLTRGEDFRLSVRRAVTVIGDA